MSEAIELPEFKSPAAEYDHGPRGSLLAIQAHFRIPAAPSRFIRGSWQLLNAQLQDWC
jgi:hypothetical protein